VDEHDIQVIPLSLLFGRERYREGVDIDTEQFFGRLSRERTFPTTSQPNPEDFDHIWHPMLEAGHQVLNILLSSGLSGTISSARAAAQLVPDVGRVVIVDSLSIAMGLGMLVLRAAELIRAGLSLDKILETVGRMREAMHIEIYLDTLEYLHRGGRINTARAWVGTLLKVKPLLGLQDGMIVPLEQARTAKRALRRLLDRSVAALGDDRHPWIAVMHSRSPSLAEDLLDALRARFPEGRFFCSEIGPVLGVHVGPGGAGVIACPSTAL
jgi:DegV family protein with EDD domain